VPVNRPLQGTLNLAPAALGLLPRLGIVAGFLAAETLVLSGLIQSTPLNALTGAARITHDIQHWAFRFAIAYAASFAILIYLRGAGRVAASPDIREAPLRMQWLLLHAALLIPFALLTPMLYRDGSMPFWLLAILWHSFGFAAAAALVAGVAPLAAWAQALRETQGLPWYSLLPAAGSLLAFKASQLLWHPAAAVTFRLVRLFVQPFCPSLRGDAAALTLTTDHFSVQVSDVCSGLEGVGLMLVFCAAWLWHFRREYIFPRALIIVPGAVLLIFLLNAVRIAALVLIGDAGHQQVATVGFHSQAGWIAFNLAAFAVAFAAKRSAWLTQETAPSIREHEATAAYLVPLLAILAAGMIAHALSAGVDLLYPLRLPCAVAALWAYRRRYQDLDWKFSWRGIAVGIVVFCVWAGFASFLTAPAAIPADLWNLPAPLRAAWIGCRITAAVLTVPIAEELAYRGFLMRRLVSANFVGVAWRSVPWPAVAVSAAAFGITHGGLWFPGILAGLGYGVLAVKTGRIGESVAAHATTNALIAIQVLLFGQWQLW
jgi:exosortase E/protease (VPEID-CTERM system)